jgi:hypothetical protein
VKFFFFLKTKYPFWRSSANPILKFHSPNQSQKTNLASAVGGIWPAGSWMVGVVGGGPRVEFGGRRRRILSCFHGWASPMVAGGLEEKEKLGSGRHSMSITWWSTKLRRHWMVWPAVAMVVVAGGCGEGKIVRERERRGGGRFGREGENESEKPKTKGMPL